MRICIIIQGQTRENLSRFVSAFDIFWYAMLPVHIVNQMECTVAAVVGGMSAKQSLCISMLNPFQMFSFIRQFHNKTKPIRRFNSNDGWCAFRNLCVYAKDGIINSLDRYSLIRFQALCQNCDDLLMEMLFFFSNYHIKN